MKKNVLVSRVETDGDAIHFHARYKIVLLVLLIWMMSLACAVNLPGSPAADTSQSLQSLNHGLGQLQSYRLSLKMRFTGTTESSQQQTVLFDTLEEAAPGRTNQPVRHFLLIASSSGEASLPNLPGALEFYQLGGRIYTLNSAEGSNPLCREATGESGTGQASPAGVLQAGNIFDLLPQIVLQSIPNAQRVAPADGAQGETINGVLSDHYRLAAASSADGQNQVEGDVWVARSGGYVVRFTGALQGPVAINLLNGSGVLGWEYNLTDINAVSSIPVPEQCLALSQAAIPLPAGAQQVQQSSTGLTYSSASTAAELLQFYQEQLPAQGWQIDEEGGGNDRFSLSASRQGQAVRITIAAGEPGQTQVSIETLSQ